MTSSVPRIICDFGKCRGRNYLLFVFISLLWSNLSQAQAPDTAGVKVTKLQNLTRPEKPSDGVPDIKRRDYIQLTVDSLPKALRNIPKGKKLVLYIDNVPFDDLEPEFIDVNKGLLTFHFQKNPNPVDVQAGAVLTESKAWIYFYKKPREPVRDKVTVSIGYTDGTSFKSDVKADLVIIQTGWFIVGVVLILALVAIFISLAVRSNLLKDSGSLNFSLRPFSIARTQFAFWLLIVASGYVFLWASTGERPELTESCLILLGISGSTSIISVVIDNSQALRLRHQDEPSQGFLTDLLSDDRGVSVHRLQILVFTIVLGVIFIHDVIVFFELPNFDANLLLLMVISSGTYAGFKTTENSSTATVG